MMDSPFLSFGRMRHCKTKFGFGEKPTNFFFFFFFFSLFIFFFFFWLKERITHLIQQVNSETNFLNKMKKYLKTLVAS